MSNPGPQLMIRVLTDGKHLSTQEYDADTSIQIGRHSECDIVINDPKVSRSHATAFFDGGVWQLSSVGSTGSYVVETGRKFNHALIDDEMQVRLGKTRNVLEFCIVRDDEDDGSTGSITLDIRGAKSGDEQSVQRLLEKCFASVARMARNQMSGAARRMSDEEDVAASVFESLYFSLVQGKLPELSDRQSLWRLISVMTRRKVADYVNRERAQKRGGGKVRGDSIGPPDAASPFDRFVGDAPTPVVNAIVEEQTTMLLKMLPSDEHRNIALCRLEGNTVTETAEILNLSVRTVERRLQQIRTTWDEELRKSDDSFDEEG